MYIFNTLSGAAVYGLVYHKYKVEARRASAGKPDPAFCDLL
jgi:hypothetical protein